MRIATWNVNSLKARLEKVLWWLERAAPDVLLMQETKLADGDAPGGELARAGYRLVHHGVGGANGVAIASRLDLTDVVTNFGLPLDAPATPEAPDDEPLREPRMISALCDGIRLASIYAPNGRTIDSIFYKAKLAWYGRLQRWLDETRRPDEPLIVGGDFNVAPTDADVWDAAAVHGGTHVSERERAAFRALLDAGLADAYRSRHDEPGRFSWWDYRAGMFHRNEGMRIDLLYATRPVAERVVWAEIDREARKGPPTPSDHAPVVIDLNEPGKPFDPGWEGALQRIAARTRPRH
jgi:exodeoxyribonuclease-3